MKLSSEQIKNHLVSKLGLDSKSLKRVSKKKDSSKNVVRVFSSNLGTHQVVSNPQDESILSVTKIKDQPPEKNKSKKSASPKIVIRDLKYKEIVSVDEIGGEDAKECFNCILEQESWIAEEVFDLLDLECGDDNYLTHKSWQAVGYPSYEDDTVIKVIVKKVHKYNLTLE